MVLTRSASSRLILLLVLVACVAVSGCTVAAGIFKAGLWIGVIMAVLIVGIVLFIISKARS